MYLPSTSSASAVAIPGVNNDLHKLKIRSLNPAIKIHSRPLISAFYGLLVEMDYLLLDMKKACGQFLKGSV